MNLEHINYKGWPNCYRLTNEQLELIVTTDIGPRVIRFGFLDGDNELKEFEKTLGKTGGEKWQSYGGHRLWHAPEDLERTYSPDNEAIRLEKHQDFIRLIQPVELATGIQKIIDVRLLPQKAEAILTHRLINTNLWTVELAPWALTVMAPNGVAIIPLPPRGSHSENLVPTNTIALWAYTDMSDPRWTWGEKYVLLRQDPLIARPQKAGFQVKDDWTAYARNGHLFLKTFASDSTARYPDFDSNVETFTNEQMLEVETLGPLVQLNPGVAIEHVEHWHLFQEIPPPINHEDVETHVMPKVRMSLAKERSYG
jgi:hypothetical protein